MDKHYTTTASTSECDQITEHFGFDMYFVLSIVGSPQQMLLPGVNK